MHFEPNTVYHIYNQGNNREPIFFQERNYSFFLEKMREFLLPYGDLLCYCLMPNHFHWLMFVRNVSLQVSTTSIISEETNESIEIPKMRSLNSSIGILLFSYTRAINRQEDRVGALFREQTKAKDGWEDHGLSPSDPGYQQLLRNWECYGATCFNYIHNNPVPKLVANPEDWPYSSFRDFAGLRNGTICNQALAKELLFLP